MYKSVKGYSNLATSILLALLLVAMSWSSIGDNVHYDGYKLIFSDEFNQADGSQPDSMKWTICKRYNSMWNRWISNSKDVVYIKDGKLVCRAIPNNSEPNDTAKMLTGAIESIGKFSFKYGIIASNTLESTQVVALLSKYTLFIIYLYFSTDKTLISS